MKEQEDLMAQQKQQLVQQEEPGDNVPCAFGDIELMGLSEEELD